MTEPDWKIQRSRRHRHNGMRGQAVMISKVLHGMLVADTLTAAAQVIVHKMIADAQELQTALEERVD